MRYVVENVADLLKGLNASLEQAERDKANAKSRFERGYANGQVEAYQTAILMVQGLVETAKQRKTEQSE